MAISNLLSPFSPNLVNSGYGNFIQDFNPFVGGVGSSTPVAEQGPQTNNAPYPAAPLRFVTGGAATAVPDKDNNCPKGMDLIQNPVSGFYCASGAAQRNIQRFQIFDNLSQITGVPGQLLQTYLSRQKLYAMWCRQGMTQYCNGATDMLCKSTGLDFFCKQSNAASYFGVNYSGTNISSAPPSIPSSFPSADPALPGLPPTIPSGNTGVVPPVIAPGNPTVVSNVTDPIYSLLGQLFPAGGANLPSTPASGQSFLFADYGGGVAEGGESGGGGGSIFMILLVVGLGVLGYFAYQKWG